MSSKKTTIAVEAELLEQLDLIAEAFDTSRNSLIADALAEYAAKFIDRARAIHQKQQEIAELKKGL